MPRAKIPYPELEKALRKKYPSPLYANVTLKKPRRDNNIRAPTTIYDRSQGNYARIGYRVQVELEQFAGIETSFRAKYATVYKRRSFEDVLFV